MVPVPLPRDDDSEPLQSAVSSRGGSSSSDDIAQLASRLAEQGIQSSELVLDLILHDLAEEARQLVNATGAAIALDRNGELVCRAAAGSTAPDLGIRMNTRSGLSGTCVRERSAQLCRDTENDDRVDAVACRGLGVRSISVLPVFSGDFMAGVLEVFSSRPNAFSADDLNKLEALAESVAETLRKAQQSFQPDSAMSLDESSLEQRQEPPSITSIMRKVAPADPGMKVLRALVIGLAIVVSILVGFDVGWHKARSPRRGLSATSGTVLAPEMSPSAQPVEQEPPGNTAPPTAPVVRAPRAAKKVSSEPAAQDGLVIYQNEKVIYRQGPADRIPDALVHPPANEVGNGSAPSVTSVSPNAVTDGRLIHSVKPKYPAQAVEQRIEGPVVLHGQVGKDGILHELAVVRGDPVLSPAALEAVQQWRYEPYKRNGAPVEMPVDITIVFNLPKP
jgi:TonB family protein